MAQLCDRVYACMINNFRAYKHYKKKIGRSMPSLQDKYLLLVAFIFSLGSDSYSGSRAVLAASASITD